MRVEKISVRMSHHFPDLYGRGPGGLAPVPPASTRGRGQLQCSWFRKTGSTPQGAGRWSPREMPGLQRASYRLIEECARRRGLQQGREGRGGRRRQRPCGLVAQLCLTNGAGPRQIMMAVIAMVWMIMRGEHNLRTEEEGCDQSHRLPAQDQPRPDHVRAQSCYIITSLASRRASSRKPFAGQGLPCCATPRRPPGRTALMRRATGPCPDGQHRGAASFGPGRPAPVCFARRRRSAGQQKAAPSPQTRRGRCCFALGLALGPALGPALGLAFRLAFRLSGGSLSQKASERPACQSRGAPGMIPRERSTI